MELHGGRPHFAELDHCDDQRDAIAVSLSEPAQSSHVWNLKIYALTDEGSFFVGELDTRPPAHGDNPARVVCYASCPGARSWSVLAFCSDYSASANLYIADGEPGGAFGLTVPTRSAPSQWCKANLAPGTYWFPSKAGTVAPKNLSLLLKSSDTADFTVELSHDDFTQTCVDCTKSALNVTTGDYQPLWTVDGGGQLQLDFEAMRAARVRVCVTVGSTPSDVLISAIEEAQ